MTEKMTKCFNCGTHYIPVQAEGQPFNYSRCPKCRVLNAIDPKWKHLRGVKT